MKHFHKIGLIVASLLVSSVCMADSFKVEWTLKTTESTALDKDAYSFKAQAADCTVSRAVKEYAPDMGLGLTESRSISCKIGKKTVQQSVYCTRKETVNTAKVVIGSQEIQLSCSTL